jgi:hypothetical protein
VTAEAVVMNKSAVAMAADSAVTISGGRSQMIKTFDTANKLFELVKGRPVGIMMFANAEVNGVPWETVIKVFREENRGLCHDTLSGYSDAFLDYLRNTTLAFSTASEEQTFRVLTYQVCLHIANYLQGLIPSCLTSAGRPIRTRLRAALLEAARHVEAFTKAQPLAPWANDLTIDDLRNRYDHIAREVYDSVFSAIPLLARDRRAALDTMIESCRRLDPQPSESGIVISGFGEREVFPSLRSFRIRGRLAGVLLVSTRDSVSISQSNPGDVRTFAQDEIAWGYLTGINSAVRGEIMRYWREWIDNSETKMRDSLGSSSLRLSANTIAEICAVQKTVLDGGFDEFLRHMQTHEDKRFRTPILSSIPFLPKSEMAVFAESLVNLTSIWQRVSVQTAQTVGGEIDVALISLGDGFVWIKRKHYFSTHLNPAWPLVHSGNLSTVTSVGTS